MPHEELKERLRLAISYMEKVRELEAECQQALELGRVEQDRYATLREFYAAHRGLAKELIADARQAIYQRIHVLEQKLPALEEEQTRVSEEVAEGGVDLKRAASRNRELEDAIRAGKEEIERLQRWADVRDSNSLGGFRDLPLEQYRPVHEALGTVSAHPHRVPAFIIPFFISATVFLPWLRVEEMVRPLYAMGAIFSRYQLDGPLPAITMDMVWLPYFILPLLSLPFTALDRHRRAGLGMITVGFACIVTVLAGYVLLAVTVDHPSFESGTIVRTIGYGALLYMAGGIVIVLLGRRRLNAGAVAPERSGKQLVAALVVALVAVLIVAWAAMFFQEGAARLRLDAGVADASTGLIRMVCQNEGEEPAILYAPWPQGAPDPDLAGTAIPAYGFSVYVRERGDDAFRLLPESGLCWTVEGMPAVNTDGLRIDAGLSVSLAFDPRYLRALGLEAEEVRLSLTRAGGDEVESITAALPGAIGPPPQDLRTGQQANATSGQAAPPNPVTSFGPSTSQASPEPAQPPRSGVAAQPDESYVPSPVSNEEEPADVLPLVRVVGHIEDDEGAGAIIEVAIGDSRERYTLRAGQTIEDVYLVESIEARPLEVRLLNLRDNTRLTLTRRTPIELPGLGNP